MPSVVRIPSSSKTACNQAIFGFSLNPIKFSADLGLCHSLKHEKIAGNSPSFEREMLAGLDFRSGSVHARRLWWRWRINGLRRNRHAERRYLPDGVEWDKRTIASHSATQRRGHCSAKPHPESRRWRKVRRSVQSGESGLTKGIPLAGEFP